MSESNSKSSHGPEPRLPTAASQVQVSNLVISDSLGLRRGAATGGGLIMAKFKIQVVNLKVIMNDFDSVMI